MGQGKAGYESILLQQESCIKISVMVCSRELEEPVLSRASPQSCCFIEKGCEEGNYFNAVFGTGKPANSTSNPSDFCLCH